MKKNKTFQEWMDTWGFQVDLGYSEEDLKDFILSIETLVNNFSFRPKKVAEDMVNNFDRKYHMSLVAHSWVSHVYNNRETFRKLADGRNEMAVERIIEFVESCKDYNLKEEVPFSFILNMHKTLMQSATGMMLAFIDLSADGDVSRGLELCPEDVGVKSMREKYGAEWYLLPLV